MVSLRVFLFSIMASLVLVPGSALALNVGFAPPTIDCGDMLPGDSKYVEFFIVTDSESDVLVELSSKTPARGFFDPGKGRFRYSFEADKASEQDISRWISFMDNSVIVPPEQTLQYLEQGGAAYANMKSGFIITIPTDAEPGYHAGFISPYPRISTQGGGTGIGIITVVEMGYVVNVHGEAVRDAQLADIRLVRDRPDSGRIITLVKNTGSVTITAMAESVKVMNPDGVLVADIKSNQVTIDPGKIGSLEAILDTRDMEGNYRVEADVEWITGSDSIKGEIDIGEYVPPAPSITGETVTPIPPPAAIPFWVVPVFLVVIVGLVYWRVK